MLSQLKDLELTDLVGVFEPKVPLSLLSLSLSLFGWGSLFVPFFYSAGKHLVIPFLQTLQEADTPKCTASYIFTNYALSVLFFSICHSYFLVNATQVISSVNAKTSLKINTKQPRYSCAW